MKFAPGQFPRPPGPSAIRVLPDPLVLTLTSVPDREAILADLDPGDRSGRAEVAASRALERYAGGFLIAMRVWCLVGLVWGLGFVAIDLVFTWVLDRPARINGRPASKGESTLFLVLYVAGMGVVLYVMDRFARTGWDRSWRLTLGPDEWELRSVYGERVLGRCAPGAIERLTLDRENRVLAEVEGRRLRLSGPLTALDGHWLLRALADALELPVDEGSRPNPPGGLADRPV